MPFHDILQLGPARPAQTARCCRCPGVTLGPAGAWATQEMVQQAIRARIGTRKPQPGGMTLRLPKIAETGNSVPLTVTVESPMTPEDHVLRLHIFIEGNPEPVAATYHFGVRTGKAEISTRIRLARSQTVLALAEMSGGRASTVWGREHPGDARRLRRRSLGRLKERVVCQSHACVSPGQPGKGKSSKSKRCSPIPWKRAIVVMSTANSSRRQIIHTFTCTYNGAEVFRADWHPAVAADPYLAYYGFTTESGRLRFEWIDDEGTVYATEAEITVA